MKKPLAVAVSRLRSDALSSNRTPNYFELFGLPESFEVDLEDLQKRWKSRAAQVHPDRYVSGSAAEKRVAMQWSAEINEGYRVLKDPVSRARYLCEINGHPPSERTGSQLDAAFLEQQMQWRESLEEIRDVVSSTGQGNALLDALSVEVEQSRVQCVEQVARMLQAQCWPQADAALQQWMFVDKFIQEIARARSAIS